MMRQIFFLAFCVAFRSLAAAAENGGLLLKNNDTAVLGGASHPCYRECVANDTRTCYYEIAYVEWVTMSTECGDCPYTLDDCYARGCITAGGDERTVTVANHMLPGISIQVCAGDIVIVYMTNADSEQSTTVHWHGMYQVETPYMDGVPFLTQCPILPSNSFVYNFTADPPGTHLWHSHVGFQETDGFHGSLIVREASDVNAAYYDTDISEHIMIVWHWYQELTGDFINSVMYRDGVALAYSLIINGFAAKAAFTKDGETYYTPRANFTVTKGLRHRFRVIGNTAIYCPVQVSVDNHTLTMIATDGATFAPVEVDSFVISAGERYDFVLSADQEVGNYWIRYRGFGMCASTSAVAILHYEGADEIDPTGAIEYDDDKRNGVLLNPVGEADTDYTNYTLVRISDLNNTMSSGVQDVSGTPDYVFYAPISMNKYNDYQTPGAYGQCNNISFSFPPVPPLTQFPELASDTFCTPDSIEAEVCNDGYCTCPYIYPMEKDKLIEMVLLDETAAGEDDHPLHLHGHYFRVVALQPGGTANLKKAEVQALNEAGLIEKNFDTAPLKDTIGVPARGYVVVRFISSNPGFWIWHCHVAAHLEEGMALVLQIGNYTDMVHPPLDFPTCSGNYQ